MQMPRHGLSPNNLMVDSNSIGLFPPLQTRWNNRTASEVANKSTYVLSSPRLLINTPGQPLILMHHDSFWLMVTPVYNERLDTK
jgi:hypothetical protein